MDKSILKIEIPEELDKRVQVTLSSLGKFKTNTLSYLGKIAAAITIILAIFTGSVLIFPGFAVVASSFPGLSGVVEWLRGDKGIDNAISQGYQKLDEVQIEKDGFILKLQDIVLDRDRIRLAAVLTGPRVTTGTGQQETFQETIIQDNPPEKDLNSNSDITNSETSEYEKTPPALGFEVRFPDFATNTSSTCSNGPGFITRDVETFLKNGELDNFLSSGKNYLNVSVSVTEWSHNPDGSLLGTGRTILTFDEIHLDFNREAIGKEYVFPQINSVSYSKGLIKIKRFSINPTRMKLLFELNEIMNGYTFTSFRNPRLIDENSKEYKPEGMIASGLTDNLTMYFVPSIYFMKKMPQELYFCYDGIEIGSETNKSFVIRPSIKNRAFTSFTHNYMDIPIEIEAANYKATDDNSGSLSITISYPSMDGKFKIQNLTVANPGEYNGGSWGDLDLADGRVRSFAIFYKIPKRDEYTLSFEFTRSLLDEPGKIKLDISGIK